MQDKRTHTQCGECGEERPLDDLDAFSYCSSCREKPDIAAWLAAEGLDARAASCGRAGEYENTFEVNEP
jgi:endogenous inhibitor of DNA gyrase (YacG/DUF329 family)